MNGDTLGSQEKRLKESQEYWNHLAPTFDDEPDHGLRNPWVLETWTALLESWLPRSNATVLDIGCGTGSLSVVLAGLGHRVTGIDLSPSMLALAKEKAAKNGLQIEFLIMDAAFPRFQHQLFDVIVCRHLLWALPAPGEVIQRWSNLLEQNGRLILIEGYWGTGSGLHHNELTQMLPDSMMLDGVYNLSELPDLWGGEVTDERFAIVADRNDLRNGS